MQLQPITVPLASLSRILAMVIIGSLREAYDSSLDNSEYGFWNNSSTDDAVFVL